MPKCPYCGWEIFQSTLPARGATDTGRNGLCYLAYFNPRSPHGERRAQLPLRPARTPISIHAPRTGSDDERRRTALQPPHFNPRSPHGERLCACSWRLLGVLISIHAPRTGSDRFKRQTIANESDFNPRSPHGERRRRSRDGAPVLTFQSTLPARGATHRYVMVSQWLEFQSTLPARGATYAESLDVSVPLFQSTLPARGATAHAVHFRPEAGISIHAPRTGSDTLTRRESHNDTIFQSTLPARGATTRVTKDQLPIRFQSTLPARGATGKVCADSARYDNFNPRSPHGERLQCQPTRSIAARFQSTLPARGATWQIRRTWSP